MTRRGVALPLALLACAVLGALAGIVLLSSRLRAIGGAGALRRARVELAARGALARHLADWGSLGLDTLPPGFTVALPAPPWPGIVFADSARREGRASLVLTSAAEAQRADGAVLARAALGFLVRLRGVALPDTAAVLALGPVLLGDSSRVIGADSALVSGWAAGCPPPTGVAPGIRAPTPPPDCSAGGCVTGAPALLQDTLLPGAGSLRLGSWTIAELAAAADRRVAGGVAATAPVAAGGSCDRSAPGNWGDPGPGLGPCTAWFPVIEAAPGTVVQGGVGQGVMVGLGGLTLAGDHQFTGVVLAAGPLLLRDSARVTGAVIVLDTLTMQGRVSVRWSYCAAMEAGMRVARGVPGPTWGEFFRAW